MASAAAARLAVGQRRRGQLPAEVTGFVGRQAEIARVSALLASARLVTVTGPAGVGKTRICLRAAAQTAGRYSSGACFIDLSGLGDDLSGPGDPGPLADAVAECLGLRNPDGLASVLGHLRDRRQLLVLDTCEHLVDACATFAEAVLREAPGVTLLATSRQPLDVPGEHTLPIAPLPAPGPDGGPGGISAGFGTGDAVELFTQRATAAVPSFRLTGETRDDVIRICRLLDGIPLALELAAVRLRALPLSELADRLEHPFQVLDGGRRGAVPRHQMLHTAISWSYDLCTPAEQALWGRLSVFPGGFDVAAAEQVCAAPGAPDTGCARYTDVVEPLIGLVDKSVVLRDDSHGTRYRLPRTTREFGALRLAASGEEDTCRDRHLSYQLAAARRFRDGIGGDGQPDLLREMRARHDDIRAALGFGLDRCAIEDGPATALVTRRPATGDAGRTAADSAADAAELATALEAYWAISGRLREGTDWLDKVIERFAAPSAQRAGALLSRACLGALRGEADGAARDAREGIRIARKLGEDALEARGYLCLHAALTLGGDAEAAPAGAEAERMLTALRDSAGLTLLGVQQARMFQLTGHPEQAVRQCKRALRRIGDGGERWLHGQLCTIAALARIHVPGEEKRCAANAVRGLRDARELDDVIGAACALEALAWIAAAAGRPVRAAWLTGAADPLWDRTGRRLCGTPAMLQAHQRAVEAAQGELGEERFAALRAQGASCRLDAIVAAAAGDADDLDTILPVMAAWQSGARRGRPAQSGAGQPEAGQPEAGQHGTGQPAAPAQPAQQAASPRTETASPRTETASPRTETAHAPEARAGAGQAAGGRAEAGHAAGQTRAGQAEASQAAAEHPAAGQAAQRPARGQAAGRAAARPAGAARAPERRGEAGQTAEQRGRAGRGEAGRTTPAKRGTAGPWLAGLDGLTGREQEIAALVASGLSNREIGLKLIISKRTVDAHVEHIFAKLGMSSRVQLTVWLRDQLPDTWGQSDAQSLP